MPWKYLTLLSFFLTLAGCGEAKHPVSGTITYKEKPLPNVRVMLVRGDGKTAFATTDTNGAFSSVTTDAPNDGALAGKYKVGITPDSATVAEPTSEKDYQASAKLPFPPKYASTETSGLEVTVEPGMAPVQLSLKD